MYKRPYELKLLLSFLPDGIIQRDSIKLLMMPDGHYSYRVLNQMEKEKLVFKSDRKIKNGSKIAYSFSSYYLTVSGLSRIHELLFGKDSEYYFETLSLLHAAYDFLECLPEAISSYGLPPDAPTCGFALMSRNPTNALGCCRLKMQEAVLELAGVISKPLLTAPYSALFQPPLSNEPDEEEVDYCEAEEDCEADDLSEAPELFTPPAGLTHRDLNGYGTLISALVHKAHAIYIERHPEKIWTLQPGDPKLQSPVFISRKSLQRNIQNSRDIQYSLSQCTGIILREHSPILTFHSGFAGTAWSKRGTTLLRERFRQMLFQHGFDRDIKDGVLFCKNAAQFINTILDKVGKRQRGKQLNSTVLGSGLQYLYCVIEVPEAEFQLKMIVEKQNPQEVLTNSIAKGNVGISRGKDTLFPLFDEYDMRCFNGTLMEAKDLCRLNELFQKEGATFSIVCFDWQEKYYRKLFPRVRMIPISVNG